MTTARLRYNSETAWPKAVKVTLDSISETYNRVIQMSPLEAALKDEEAAKRKLSRMYGARKVFPGDYVRVNVRALGTAEEHQSFKKGNRKVGQVNWSEDIYVVKRRVKHGYR